VADSLQNPQLKSKKDTIHEETVGTQGNKTTKK
jgi:hypothetical protein